MSRPFIGSSSADSRPLHLNRSTSGIATDFAVGRAVEPLEVAKLYLFLASDDAVMVSGSNYRMDGGMLLH